jgi:hypothetical protein
MSGRADVQIFEFVQHGATILETAAKLPRLNPLLACVSIERARRYSKVFCGLGVLQPRIGIAARSNCWQDYRGFWHRISESGQGLAQ